MIVLKKFLLPLFMVFSVSIFSQEAEDLLSIPGPVNFEGTEFFLKRSNQPSKVIVVQDYLPRDQDLSNFTEMLSFYYFTKEIAADGAAKQKIQEVQRKMEKDRFADVNLTENEAGREFVVDYVLSKSPEGKTPSADFNVYRFKEIATGAGKHLLIVVYTKRESGDLKSISKNFSRSRVTELSRMINFQLPAITLKTPAAN